MKRAIAFSLLLLLWATSSALALPTIVLEDPLFPGSGGYGLYENMPNQTIQVFVTGGESITGVNYNIQIGDGGVEVGGLTVGPRLTALDFITDTIFEDNHTAPLDSGVYPQIWMGWIMTAHDTVPADGLLATFTIDTTGLFAGDPVHSWSLAMGNTLNGPSNFTSYNSYDTIITDGTLSLIPIPEPSTFALMATGLVGIVLFAVRRKRVQ